jgi:hypothetical protein
VGGGGGGGAAGRPPPAPPNAAAPPPAPSPSTSSSTSSSSSSSSSSSRPSSPPPRWEDELRRLADRHKLSRQVCEAAIRAHDDVVSARDEYASCVEAENAAVEEARALERKALDSLQRLEEVRDGWEDRLL